MNKKPLSIVLVNVYYAESGYGERLLTPPLGIGYLSEYLYKNNVDHHVIDMGLGYTKDQVLDKVKELNARAIGFSINSLCMDKTADLIKAAKEAVPTSHIILGGPHVSTIKEAIFTECPSVDYAIVGEGEESLLQVLRGDPPERIGGLLYRDDTGKVHSNQKRITEHIDTIHFPKFRNCKLDLYADTSIPLLTSRGCPYKCIFCQQSSLLSKNWRGKSAEYFVEEIQYWLGKGHRQFQILDDNFAYDADRLESIEHLFSKNNISNITINIVGGIRVSAMTKEKLLLLKNIGVEFVSFGVESLSDKVLRFIRKGTSRRQIERIVRMSTEIGFKVRLFFIIGFPYETPESLEDIFTFIKKYPIYQVRFFNLVPYQGTALMEWITTHGTLLYSYKEYMNNFRKYQDTPLFDAPFTMSIKEREEALQKARHIADSVHERFMKKALDTAHETR